MAQAKQKPNIPSKIYDSVGSVHGVLTGCTFAPESPFSNIPGSLKFTATSDAVNLGDFSACESQSAFTICGWALKDNVANGGTLFRKISTSTSSLGAYFTNVSGMKFVVEVRNGAANYAVWDFAGVISNNTWFHWALVFDGGGATNADKLKLYVNKVSRTLTFTLNVPTTTPANTATAYLGWDTSVTALVGKMKDVRAYSAALSQSRIDALYDNTSAPYIDTTNLLSQWQMNDYTESKPAMITNTGGGIYPADSVLVYSKFEEGTGTSAFDESKNVRTGTLAKTTTGNLPVWVSRNDAGGTYALDFTTGSKVQYGTGIRPTSSFTFLCVFEADSLGSGTNYPVLVSDGDYVSGTDRNGWHLFLNYAGSGLLFQTNNGGSTATNLYISHATLGIATGIKYHLAAVFDDTGNTLKVYINGIEKGSIACSHSIAYGASGEQYTVGFSSDPSVPNDNNYGIDGRIFYHACLNSALDATAVFDNYKKTLGVQQ